MAGRWIPLDIFGPAYQNIDESGLTRLSSRVVNCYLNESNQTLKRPGLADFVDLGTSAPVDGLFWWETEKIGLAISDKRVWRIENVGGSVAEYSGTATLLKNVPVSFAKDTVRAYIANGGKIAHFTKTGSLTDMADADAPNPCTHVAFLDQYIFGNLPMTGQWQISEVTDGLTWRAVDIFTAESSPDNLLAIHTAFGEVIFIGTESTEYWQNDGVSPFSVIKGSTQQLGGASPYTFALLGNPGVAHWFTNTRRLIEVTADKRIPTMVSLAINRELDALSDVSDARGFPCTIDGLPLYVLTFPNADRTFVYNFALKNFSEWSTWDTVHGIPTRWRGTNYAYAKDWNLHLVGDHSNGKIYKASASYFNDAGKLIRLSRRSGFNDHGTPELKRSFRARFRFERAQGNADVADPKFLLRWRNNTGAWGPFSEGSLGAEGDHDFFVDFHMLGSYYTRQWEFIYTDDAGFNLVSAKELVDSGGSESQGAQQNTTTPQQ